MISLNGRECHYAHLFVPWRGRWVLDVKLAGAAPTGRVTVAWGAAGYIGTVDPEYASSFNDEAFVRVIGGFGWSRVLKTEAGWLHNDAGLSGAKIADAIARVVGETIQADAGAFRQGRISHARAAVNASTALVDLLNAGQDWWAEPSGVTRAGVRPSPILSGVELLDWTPGQRSARVYVDDPSAITLGGIIPASVERGNPALRIFELNAVAMGSEERYTVSVNAPDR